MNEKVNSFRTAGNFVEVTFSISAMIFRLEVNRPDFAEVMGVLAACYRDDSDVKYTADGDLLKTVVRL